MVITLIGMSGAGKTYWSKKLAQSGFRRFCCDDLIEEKMKPELQKQGYAGIQDMARWMGQPYDTQYADTSRKYLELETEVMKELLQWVEKHADQNILVDTTGSVIYTEEAIQDKLKRLTIMVYLETPEKIRQKMFQLYIRDPKPVIWGNSYDQKIDETEKESLARCYPKLLAYRGNLYENLADITLPYNAHKSPSYSTRKLLREIEKYHYKTTCFY